MGLVHIFETVIFIHLTNDLLHPLNFSIKPLQCIGNLKKQKKQNKLQQQQHLEEEEEKAEHDP